MSYLTPELLQKLIEAQRIAECVVGWQGDIDHMDPIYVHDFRYINSTSNERECKRCKKFMHYGPRLSDKYEFPE